MAVQEQHPTLAPETEEEPIGEPSDTETKPLVEEPTDITPDDFLTEQSVPNEGFYTLSNGKKIKLVSITEKELDAITQRSKRPDREDPRRGARVDALMLRRNMVAFSMSKAANRLNTAKEIVGQHLLPLPPGLITEMQRKVQELSGFVEEAPVAPDPMRYFN